jgi:hypothetical protein
MKAVLLAVVIAVTLSYAAENAWPQTGPSNDTLTADARRDADVQALLGPPDAIIVEAGRTIWLYNRKVKDGAGRRAYPEIRFVDGQVRSIQWLSETRMFDRLRDAKR